eukprot:snap_masked-scaffold_26-processed-gene-2.50-mRNA-1 protein AED:1.00 eAED:1.00 QI:0/0/0/0/1/1/2/0/165
MYLRKPQVDHLFEFGRLGAARSGKQQKKGEMKGRKAIFLGYKGREYLVYWLDTKKVATARPDRFFKRVTQNEAVSEKKQTEFSLNEPNDVDAETDAPQEEEKSEPHQSTNESTPQSVPIGPRWSEIDAGNGNGFAMLLDLLLRLLNYFLLKILRKSLEEKTQPNG